MIPNVNSDYFLNHSESNGNYMSQLS